MQMNSKRKHGGNRSVQIATGILVVAAVAASFTIWFHSESVLAQGQTSSAVFLPDGKLKLPTGFRNWGFCRRPAHPERTERRTGKFSRIPQRLCGGP
jgi:hypothetical protein